MCLNSTYTKGYTVISESLIVFEQMKKEIILDRPIQLGVTILEFAKLSMFSYYHNVLKKTFGDQVRLIYTDTDLFVLELRTRDLFNDLQSISHTLDNNNFPQTGHYLSDLFSSDKSSELFYFKSEVGVDEIVAFIAIWAKVYTLISISSKNGQIEGGE